MAVTATKRSKPKTPAIIPITVPLAGSGNEEAHANSSLQTALRKTGHANVAYFSVPTPEDDVYCKSIICKLRPREADDDEEAMDMPDMSDLSYTDLPWCGFVTFRQAARQFRNKNLLAVRIQVVREIDGFLWNLTNPISVGDGDPAALALITLAPRGRLANQDVMSVNRNLTTAEHFFHFNNALELPVSLTNELFKIGYSLRYTNNVPTFYLPDDEHGLSSIRVDLYGKMLRPTKV